MRATAGQLVLAIVLIAAAGAPAACSSDTNGSPVSQAPATAPTGTSSAPSTSPRATVTVTSTPPRTVTVAPTQRVVTHVQAPSAPQSYPALAGLLDNATVVSNDDYYSSGGDGVFFDAPSQNIGCYLTGDGTAECAIHDYDFPQNGPDCNAGIGATLDAGGYPSLTGCSGYFPVADRGTVLRYGTALEGDDLACVSEPAGVSCLNTDTHTGFTLSKQAFTPIS